MITFIKESTLTIVATCSILGSLSCGTPPDMPTGRFTPLGTSIEAAPATFAEDAIYTLPINALENDNYILLYRAPSGIDKAEHPRR